MRVTLLGATRISPYVDMYLQKVEVIDRPLTGEVGYVSERCAHEGVLPEAKTPSANERKRGGQTKNSVEDTQPPENAASREGKRHLCMTLCKSHIEQTPAEISVCEQACSRQYGPGR
jgi:hypothetical protein